jgi:chromosome segregation ATPase
VSPYRFLLAVVCVAPLLGGCVYLDARQNVRPGGKIDTEIKAATEDLRGANDERTRLGDEKARREAEMKGNDERIRTVQADLQKQEQLLQDALAAKKLSQARYAELKRELAEVKAESQSIDVQLKSAAFRPSDVQADAAKEQRLRELERRKKALEKTLAEAISTR